MNLRYIIKADLSRWFLQKNFFFIVLLIVAVNYIILQQNVPEITTSDVVYNMVQCVDDPFFSINYMLASGLFASAYCKETENNFLIFCRIRCSLKQYTASKTINCFLSAFTVLFCGVFLWGISLRAFLPWADYTEQYGDQFSVFSAWGMGKLLTGHHFLLYFILECMGIGLLGGILAMISFLFSLLIQIDILVQILPPVIQFLSTSLIEDLFPQLYGWTLTQVLFFPYSPYPSAVKTFLRGTVYALVLADILGYSCYRIFFLKERKDA